MLSVKHRDFKLLNRKFAINVTLARTPEMVRIMLEAGEEEGFGERRIVPSQEPETQM